MSRKSLNPLRQEVPGPPRLEFFDQHLAQYINNVAAKPARNSRPARKRRKVGGHSVGQSSRTDNRQRPGAGLQLDIPQGSSTVSESVPAPESPPQPFQSLVSPSQGPSGQGPHQTFPPKTPLPQAHFSLNHGFAAGLPVDAAHPSWGLNLDPSPEAPLHINPASTGTSPWNDPQQSLLQSSIPPDLEPMPAQPGELPRAVVSDDITVRGPNDLQREILAMYDEGSDHTFLKPWVAKSMGCDPIPVCPRDNGGPWPRGPVQPTHYVESVYLFSRKFRYHRKPEALYLLPTSHSGYAHGADIIIGRKLKRQMEAPLHSNHNTASRFSSIIEDFDVRITGPSLQPQKVFAAIRTGDGPSFVKSWVLEAIGCNLTTIHPSSLGDSQPRALPLPSSNSDYRVVEGLTIEFAEIKIQGIPLYVWPDDCGVIYDVLITGALHGMFCRRIEQIGLNNPN